MFDEELLAAAEQLLALCRIRKVMIATAESCTGGLLSALLTACAGSSDVFERGFVTYANAAKNEMLDVPEGMLAQFGAVSEELARAMAQGALLASRADMSIDITGIAAPAGGAAEKPVGLVHLACAHRDAGGGEVSGGRGAIRHRECRFGDIGRCQVRRSTLEAALDMMKETAAAWPA
jgi:nicotinamide-nucleotide amidase